jgi:predicted ATPase
MLKSIEIRNFRSCKDASISDLPGLVALIGRNAAGKTNVLRAIEWAAKLASGDVSDESIIRYVLPGDRLERGQPHISMSVGLGQQTYSYDVGFSLIPSGKPPSSFRIEMSESLFMQDQGGSRIEVCTRKGENVKLAGNGEPVKIGVMAPCLPALNALISADSTVVKTIRPLLDFFRAVRYYPLDESSDATDQFSNAGFVQDEEYKKWLAHYEQSKVPGPSVLMRLVHMNDQGRLPELESILGKNGLGLIDKIFVLQHSWPEAEGKRKALRVFHMINFQVSNSHPAEVTPLSYAQLSCGTRRMVRIIISLLFDHDSVMLMEHPEDGVHTGLVRKLVTHVRANCNSTQVIMSSHSLTLLNTLSPHEIRLVTMDDGKTNIRAFTQRELKVANKFISEQGGNLADFVESVEE